MTRANPPKGSEREHSKSREAASSADCAKPSKPKVAVQHSRSLFVEQVEGAAPKASLGVLGPQARRAFVAAASSARVQGKAFASEFPGKLEWTDALRAKGGSHVRFEH